jgi:hypothetical protein
MYKAKFVRVLLEQATVGEAADIVMANKVIPDGATP